MERIADDAVALLDHLAEDQAVFAGLSMGGYAAFALHRRHRDRVRALVLADTRAEADTDEGRAARAALSERVRREGAEPAVDAMLPRLLSSHARSSNPELVETVRGMMLAAPAAGITDALAGLGARADSTPTLREIRCPVLVMVGEEDELTPVGSAETIHQGHRRQSPGHRSWSRPPLQSGKPESLQRSADEVSEEPVANPQPLVILREPRERRDRRISMAIEILRSKRSVAVTQNDSSLAVLRVSVSPCLRVSVSPCLRVSVATVDLPRLTAPT